MEGEREREPVGPQSFTKWCPLDLSKSPACSNQRYIQWCPSIPVMSCVIMELKVLDEICATEGFGVLRSDATMRCFWRRGAHIEGI